MVAEAGRRTHEEDRTSYIWTWPRAVPHAIVAPPPAPPPDGRRNAIDVVQINRCSDVRGSGGRFFALQTTAPVSTSRTRAPLSCPPTASANKSSFAERQVSTSTLILPPLVCVIAVGETLPREEEEEAGRPRAAPPPTVYRNRLS